MGRIEDLGADGEIYDGDGSTYAGWYEPEKQETPEPRKPNSLKDNILGTAAVTGLVTFAGYMAYSFICELAR